MTPSIMVERCNAVQFRLNVTYADCHLQALFAECHCAEHHYVEWCQMPWAKFLQLLRT